jgi:dihydrofolate reductase
MIKAIFATDEENGIGKNGTLPWEKNSDDLKRFREKTLNNIVVMGSKTWDDPFFPGPLKDRNNFVITRSSRSFDGAEVIRENVKDIILLLNSHTDKDVWIIGGAKIIELCFDIIDEFHVTKIKGNYNCDVKININYSKLKLIEIKENVNTYSIYRKKV